MVDVKKRSEEALKEEDNTTQVGLYFKVNLNKQTQNIIK